LQTEIAVIKAETKCMIQKVFELGNGDLAIGSVKAFAAGVIDIPFAPSKFNAGKMMPARDNQGAIRYLHCGNIPFSQELVDYNRKKLEQRGNFEQRKVSFQMTIDDIFAVGKGVLIGRPKNKI